MFHGEVQKLQRIGLCRGVELAVVACLYNSFLFITKMHLEEGAADCTSWKAVEVDK